MTNSRALHRIIAPLLLSVATCSTAAQAREPASPAEMIRSRQILEIAHGKQSYPMPVYSNRDLGAASLPGIKHVIIILHGINRDADRYAATALQAVETAPGRARDTLVIAPKFADPNERNVRHLPAWRREAWVTGEPSVAGPNRPPPISSYQALDDLQNLLAAKGKLPLLRDITLAGHSAGAQMLQRYAVLSPVADRLAKAGLKIDFVIANPSSYLYLTADRPTSAKRGFGPYNRGICAEYDNYRYGLDNLIPYARERDAHTLARRYAARSVTYLLGGADNNPEQRLLDKSCGAEAQGATRLQRGLSYFRYERTLTAAGSWRQHSGYEVTGIGHNAREMFTSVCGARTLAGDRAKGADKGAACTPLR